MGLKLFSVVFVWFIPALELPNNKATEESKNNTKQQQQPSNQPANKRQKQLENHVSKMAGIRQIMHKNSYRSLVASFQRPFLQHDLCPKNGSHHLCAANAFKLGILQENATQFLSPKISCPFLRAQNKGGCKKIFNIFYNSLPGPAFQEGF